METPTFRSGNRGAVYPDYALTLREVTAAMRVEDCELSEDGASASLGGSRG